MAVTQGINKVEQRLRHENDFQQAIEKIEKMLTKKRKKKYLITYAWPHLQIFINKIWKNKSFKKSWSKKCFMDALRKAGLE